MSTSGIVTNAKGDIIKHRIRHGYHYVVLYIDGKKQWFRVNRLVAMAYIPNPENKPIVNHKDGNKDNNEDWNLEWATHSDNLIHAYQNFLRY